LLGIPDKTRSDPLAPLVDELRRRCVRKQQHTDDQA
jgi:hypothetical protein